MARSPRHPPACCTPVYVPSRRATGPPRPSLRPRRPPWRSSAELPEPVSPIGSEARSHRHPVGSPKLPAAESFPPVSRPRAPRGRPERSQPAASRTYATRWAVRFIQPCLECCLIGGRPCATLAFGKPRRRQRFDLGVIAAWIHSRILFCHALARRPHLRQIPPEPKPEPRDLIGFQRPLHPIRVVSRFRAAKAPPLAVAR